MNGCDEVVICTSCISSIASESWRWKIRIAVPAMSRIPALHSLYRSIAGTADGDPDSQQRSDRRRLVRSHHPGLLPLGEEALQPPPVADPRPSLLSGLISVARWRKMRDPRD